MDKHIIRHQRGVGLIEVLVTLIVLSIGLLGMAALQARGQQAEVESYQRAQALILLEDMANRINTNRDARACYELPEDPGYLGTSQNFNNLGCDGRADQDLAAWHNLLTGAAEQAEDDTLVGAMIGARGCIEMLQPDASVFRISVAWQGLSSTTANADNDCAQGLYGDDDAQRRVLARTIRFADLGG